MAAFVRAAPTVRAWLPTSAIRAAQKCGTPHLHHSCLPSWVQVSIGTEHWGLISGRPVALAVGSWQSL